MSGERRARRATGADVASLAGVSRATVSYVLNDTPHQTIAEDTRRRVLEAAAALQYRPSPAARTLRTGRSDVVLGLVPEDATSPVYQQCFTELGRELAAAGLVLVVRALAADMGGLAEACRVLAPSVVVSLGELDELDLEVLAGAGVQLAVSIAHGPPLRHGHLVLTDDVLGQAQADHLLERGHASVAFALPAGAGPIRSGRVEAFVTRFEERGHPRPVVGTVPADPVPAATSLREWRALRPDLSAVAAWDDDVAAWVLRGSVEVGLVVPADLAILGAHNLPIGRRTLPQLTTVVLDLRARMAEVAAAVVASLAGAPTELAPLDRSAVTVVVRGST